MTADNLCGVQSDWEIISSKTCFEDKNLQVVAEEIRSPARTEPRSWKTVRRKRAVVIAPMTAEGKLVLIRQERIPIRATIWEVPAGQVDEEAETVADAIAAVGV